MDPATRRPLPCLRCRSQRKRCTLERPSCGRCAKSSHPCKYPSTKTGLPVMIMPAAPYLSPSYSPPRASLLDRLAASPLLFEDSISASSPTPTIEDPDMMPSLDDWLLLHSYIYRDGKAVPDHYANFRKLVDNFFTSHPAIRLTMCAMAAVHKRDKGLLTERICMSYYNRARKGVLRSLDKPCLSTVQAFYFINSFATMRGQPEIGKPFFLNAIRQIVGLRLDVDPDDSPWLDYLNLSEIDKEERRRIYWACFYRLNLLQSMSNDYIVTSMKVGLVRPPRGISDSSYEFTELPEISSLASIYHLITTIKRFYANSIPDSISEMLYSITSVELMDQCVKVHSEIPEYLLLLLENPWSLSSPQKARLCCQISKIPYACLPGTSQLNFAYYASLCIINRPKLYLSAFLSSSTQLLQNQELKAVLLGSWRQAIHSASSILLLLNFFWETQRSDNDGVANGLSPEHRDFLEPSTIYLVANQTAESVQAWVLRFVKESLQSIHSNVLLFCPNHRDEMLVPLITCVEFMIREMHMLSSVEESCVVEQTRNVITGNDIHSRIQSIECGMRVMSLGAGGVQEG
ncbi:hypothetical protein BDR26DRAFT_925249 [Obelidium mucronatum]|nr:hypothetical protein BDR26DRAFT_925249 [Obelidium mucronatum]